MDRIKSSFRILVSALTPSTRAWQFASFSLAGVWLAYLLYHSVLILLPNFTAYKALGFLTIILSLLLVGSIAYLTIRLLGALPRRFAFMLIVPLPLLLLALYEIGEKALAVLSIGGLFSIALIAGSLGSIYHAGFKPNKQKVVLSTLVLATIMLSVTIFLVFFKYEDPNPTLAEYKLPDRTLNLADPSLPGRYQVLYTTYGSGSDLHRLEFAEEAGFRSKTVDGSKLIDNWENTIGWSRTGYWGFDPKSLPVQGRVWYPIGEGPFPLVLIVHGNHGMEDFSDPGYEYLGELLASRGYIFVSVDENFLNSSIADWVNPLDPNLIEENDARGWVLLEHLKQWQDWQKTDGHPFSGRVDMDNISLIGHSRGGEAVAVASYFNDLDYYPDDATLSFDYHFNIKGIIAIAPVDGQYKPREKGTPLTNSSYFSIHGSMDGDVTSFNGLSQFNRVELTKPGQFSATLYVSGANHGQFNTTWGDQDTLLGWGLNKDPIMPEEAQRKIAEVYFSAFLDIVHKGQTGYEQIFGSAEYAAGWLPDTYYINNYRNQNTEWVMNFEEDGNPATASIEGAIISTENLSRWNEAWIKLKWNPLETHAVNISWDDEHHEKASLNVHFGTPIDLSVYEELVFSVSQSTEDTMPKGFEPSEKDNDGEQGAEKQDDERKPASLDWSIVLVDSDNNQGRMLLSDIESLYPQVKQDTLKPQFGYTSPQSEAVLKYYAFSLSDFVTGSGTFNGLLSEVRFEFDQSERGSIILDDLGITRRSD